MSALSCWRAVLERVAVVPNHLRSPAERAQVAAAERIRAVAQGLREPECHCCSETVQQMADAAALLEEVVGCG